MERMREKRITELTSKIDLKLKAAVCLFIASKTVGSRSKLSLSIMSVLLKHEYSIATIAREERNGKD